MTELVFLFSADADIQAAYEFYEDCQPGRGEIFLRLLDVALGRVREFPEIAPVFHGTYRRLLIADFPFGVFYSLESRRIIIAAVMDLRQDPDAIRKRLGG